MNTIQPVRILHPENIDAWIADRQKWRKPLSVVMLLAVVFLGVCLRLANMHNIQARSPDEHIYTLEANTILHEGMAHGIRTIADKFRADPKLFYFPTPNRVGYLWLLSKVMWVSNHFGPEVGAWLSCATNVGSLLVVALLGWQFFNRRIAILASLFFAVSPVELALARRAWQESVIELLALVLIYLTCRITTDEQIKDWMLPLLVVVGGAGITIKELSGLVFFFCIAWIFWSLFQRRNWKLISILLCGSALTVCAAVMWEAHLFGSLHGLLSFDLLTQHIDSSNPYRLVYMGGPKYLMLAAFWVLCPVGCLFCVLGLVTTILKPSHSMSESSRQITIWLAIYFVTFFAFPIVIPNRMNLRYINVLMGPFCLLAALGFMQVFSFVRSKLDKIEAQVFAAVMCAILVGGAFADYQNFRARFVNPNTSELSVKAILDSGNQLPASSQNTDSAASSSEIRRQLESAIQLASSEPTLEHWMQLAYLFRQTGQLQNCVAALQGALRAKPDSAEAYNNLAVVYGDMHDWDNAIASAQRALQLKPDYAIAKKNLDAALDQRRNSIR